MSIRKHIELIENMDDDGRWSREKTVESMLRVALEKAGLTVADGPYMVTYSEEDREIQIGLYEDASLVQLQAFAVFGDVSVRSHASHRDVLLLLINNVNPDIASSKIT